MILYIFFYFFYFMLHLLIVFAPITCILLFINYFIKPHVILRKVSPSFFFIFFMLIFKYHYRVRINSIFFYFFKLAYILVHSVLISSSFSFSSSFFSFPLRYHHYHHYHHYPQENFLLLHPLHFQVTEWSCL